jgi:cytoskeletal protein CcmA (bactofilin family)
MKRKDAADHISTLLGMGTSIEGTLVFQDTIRLDGKLVGKILSEKGTLIVGERAVIEAEIQVGTAVISGTVDGQIKAAERIDVHAPAKITGDIQAPVVSIETGVGFNGKCTMTKPAPQPATPSPATEQPADKKPV